MEPTANRDRIVLLDILRGLAVFGMFTVNMSADLPWGSAFREGPLSIADNTAMIAVDLLNANLLGADLTGAFIRSTRFCRTILSDGRVDNSGC